MTLEVGTRHPQDALDAASPGDAVVADPSVEYTLDESRTITTPRLTVSGLTLRLGRTSTRTSSRSAPTASAH